MKTTAALLFFALALPAFADDADAAVTKGLAALAKSQQADGHWGAQFSVAVTSLGGLAILAGEEEPFKDAALWKAYGWLKANQKEGEWPQNGHTWLHGQGFATLFMAELYGRALTAKEPPKEIDMAELKLIVQKATALVVAAQSETGGWFYMKAAGSEEHEGSTTVCAVQALRAAQNFGFTVPEKTLERGFAYLKETQNADGGFQYQKGRGGSMVAGSAGALSTLVLMSRLDDKVLFNAVEFLKKTGLSGLAADRFPFYGMFYAMMAFKVIDEEYGAHVPDAAKWMPAISEAIVKKQKEDGSWANESWMKDNEASSDYSTAFATLTLSGPKGRLSIFHRDPPELPATK